MRHSFSFPVRGDWWSILSTHKVMGSSPLGRIMLIYDYTSMLCERCNLLVQGVRRQCEPSGNASWYRGRKSRRLLNMTLCVHCILFIGAECHARINQSHHVVPPAAPIQPCVPACRYVKMYITKYSAYTTRLRNACNPLTRCCICYPEDASSSSVQCCEPSSRNSQGQWRGRKWDANVHPVRIIIQAARLCCSRCE